MWHFINSSFLIFQKNYVQKSFLTWHFITLNDGKISVLKFAIISSFLIKWPLWCSPDHVSLSKTIVFLFTGLLPNYKPLLPVNENPATYDKNYKWRKYNVYYDDFSVEDSLWSLPLWMFDVWANCSMWQFIQYNIIKS